MSGERFVNSLRARDEAIRLVADNVPASWTIRVQGVEVLDAVRVVVQPTTLVRDVKQAAMTALMPDVDTTDGYVVKLRGIEIVNENATLESAGALDGSTLLVMSRRRRPVR